MATHAPIKFYTSLSEIYPKASLLSQGQRWEDLSQSFIKEFGSKPSHIVRAPGRINLIGEHIDYCLFGVMPAAVEMDTLIAISSSPSPSSSQPTASSSSSGSTASSGEVKVVMNITNSNPAWKGSSVTATYTPASRPRTPATTEGQSSSRVNGSHSHGSSRDGEGEGQEQEQENVKGGWTMSGGTGKRGDWVAYLNSSLESVLNEYIPNPTTSTTPPSLNLMVTGNIPPGSGLSSSAALIVASLLSVLVGNDLISSTDSNESTRVTNKDLVQLARDAEAKIGVNSGGMDQSASVLAMRNTGLFVSFYPSLAVSPVKLPSTADGEELVMVIANSLATHNLAEDAKRHYNLRVLETLIAARALANGLGLECGEKGERVQLRGVLAAFLEEDASSGKGKSTEELEEGLMKMLEKVEEILGGEEERRRSGYLEEELPALTGLSKEEFEDTFLSFIATDTSEQDGRFRLYHRAKHVFAEALRALQVKRICEDAAKEDGEAGSGDAAQRIGELMSASHASCRDVYECSSEELNELQELCRKAGSLGSRMSGAGWGGCVVSLIPASKEEAFIKTITDKQTGYRKYREMDATALSTAVFKSIPGSGAGVLAV